MKEIITKNGTIGSIKYERDDNGSIEILEVICGKTDEGQCFKDEWSCGDVIYISEYGALDFSNKNNNGTKFEDVSWTKESWCEWVKEELRWEDEDSAIWTDESFVEYIARFIFDSVQWEELPTRLSEWLGANDIEDEYRAWRERNRESN